MRSVNYRKNIYVKKEYIYKTCFHDQFPEIRGHSKKNLCSYRTLLNYH